MQQTPILQTYQVWDLAALVLAAATFPLCLLPLRLIRKDYNRASSSRQLRRNHLLLLILWIAITASHTLLILFPIVGFFEQVCEDGTPMSLDTANQFLKRCKRSYINTLVEAMEVLTLPAYPALMVSTYLQLLPTTVRQRTVRVARLVNGALSALTLTYFCLMVTQRLLHFTGPPIPAGSQATQPGAIHTSFWIAELPRLFFFAWFFAMVFIGLFAMVLALRLLPYLNVAHPRASPLASAIDSGPSPKAFAVRLGRKSLDRLAITTHSGSQSSSAAAVASSTSTLATGRVLACVRRLKLLLASILSLLVLSSILVVLDLFPRVMYVTSGWVCGRAVTVTLFVATREIKHAVMARRLVPSNAVGVTLAATAWSGHEAAAREPGEQDGGGNASGLEDATATQLFESRSVSDAQSYRPNVNPLEMDAEFINADRHEHSMTNSTQRQEELNWDLAGLVLSAVTFPLCVLPVRAILSDRNRQWAMWSRGHQNQKHLGLLSLWITIAVSHLVLISYNIVGLLERACNDGHPAVWDTLDELRRCKRNYIGTLVESIEVLTLPVYPALMVSTYIQLLPTNTRHWVVRVARLVKLSLAGLTLAYFSVMLAQRLFYFTIDYPYGLSPSSTPSVWADFVFWTIDMPTWIFITWFFALVAVGLLALALTVRLLPFLDLSHSRTTSPSHSGSNTSGGQGATLDASAGKRASSVLVRFGRKSQELLADTAVPSRSLLPPFPAAERVQACTNQLRFLIGVMGSFLALSTLMVVFDWFPRALYVTIGWVSGRVLTVALFVATREIKDAVMARRMVPAHAVGMTLAATAWSGHSETVGAAVVSGDGGQASTILPCRSVSGVPG